MQEWVLMQQTPYQTEGLQECSRCHNILSSVCSRIKGKGEDDSRPMIIKQSVPNKTKSRRLKFDDSDDNDELDDLLTVECGRGK